MLEINEDLWKLHDEGHPVVVTTNGVINSRGEAVMGAGVALEAKRRYPNLPKDLARWLESQGNHTGYWTQYNLFTFPTKYDWRLPSDLSLIEQSAREMLSIVERLGEPSEALAGNWGQYAKVYMPKPGCGNGGLKWDDVKPVLEKILDDRFIVCCKGSEVAWGRLSE